MWGEKKWRWGAEPAARRRKRNEGDCHHHQERISQGLPLFQEKEDGGVPAVVLCVKDQVLPQLWLEFRPWPGNFHMPWVQPDQKKKRKEKKKEKGREGKEDGSKNVSSGGG